MTAMRNVQLSPQAIEQLQLFKSGQQKLAFKVFELIADIQQHPFTGKGKPELLKNELQDYWSRRINDEHRLVYKVTDALIIIYTCYGHYEY